RKCATFAVTNRMDRFMAETHCHGAGSSICDSDRRPSTIRAANGAGRYTLPAFASLDQLNRGAACHDICDCSLTDCGSIKQSPSVTKDGLIAIAHIRVVRWTQPERISKRDGI